VHHHRSAAGRFDFQILTPQPNVPRVADELGQLPFGFPADLNRGGGIVVGMPLDADVSERQVAHLEPSAIDGVAFEIDVLSGMLGAELPAKTRPIGLGNFLFGLVRAMVAGSECSFPMPSYCTHGSNILQGRRKNRGGKTEILLGERPI